MTEENKQFMITGLETYDFGLRAMARFRKEIYEGAGESMKRNLARLADATKLRLNDSNIKPFARPEGFRDEVEWGHLKCDIGASLDVRFTDIRAAVRWDQDARDEVQRVVYVSFACLKRAPHKTILASARDVEPHAVRDGNGKVWLEEPVTAANIAEVENVLDGIFERWQRIFEKAGGFPKQQAS